MNNKPFYNALSAELYIIIVVFLIQNESMLGGGKDNILIPIAMLSLLVLSVAVMGYLFVAQPIQLYLEEKKKEAISFFLQTVFIFAGVTALLFVALVAVSASIG